MSTWDAEGYWNAVLGPYETPAKIAANLVGFRADDARDVGDWLARTDALVWERAAGGGPMPPEWAEHRATAVALIVSAASAASPTLCDYETGETIREATEQEMSDSIAQALRDGGAGVILVDGRSCYVEAVKS